MTEPRLQANSPQESLGLEYFSTPSRLGLIQQVVYILQFGEGLPVVQGAAGSGKTFIASELASSLGADGVVGRITLDKSNELDKILRDMAQALGISTAGMRTCGELLVALRRHARELVDMQQLAVVIVDNAHFLDEAARGALLSLLQGDFEAGKGLKMVFFARPGLVDEIDKLELVDITVFDFEVPLMSLAELKNFIADFYPELSELSHEKITQAWNGAGGNPGEAISSLSQIEDNGSSGLSLSLPRFEAVKSIKWPSFSNFSLSVKHVLLLIVSAVVFAWVVLVKNSGEQELFALPKEAVPLPERMDTLLEGEQIVSDLELTEAETEQVAKATTPWPKSVNGPAPSSPPEENVVVQPAPKKLAEVAGSVNQGAGSSAHSSDEQHLLEQPPNYYTLQVLSSARSLSLSSYLLRQSNRKQLYLYRSLREGQRRYVVVAGIYKSRAEALAAKETLPKEQQKAGPWPRSLKSVQREIEKF